jgi:hypothetical protein
LTGGSNIGGRSGIAVSGQVWDDGGGGRGDGVPRQSPDVHGRRPGRPLVAIWFMLLLAALVAAVIGLGTAAKWLFIVAVVLLVMGLAGLGRGRRTRV